MLLESMIGVDRFTFLHMRNSELQSMKKHSENWSTQLAKESFDYFYEEVNNWRSDFNTERLADFWAIGLNYDGYVPGLNKNFLGLYQELMDIALDPSSYTE